MLSILASAVFLNRVYSVFRNLVRTSLDLQFGLGWKVVHSIHMLAAGLRALLRVERDNDDIVYLRSAYA